MPTASNRFIDETGNRYGRLVIQRFLGKEKHNNATWDALCDCGQSKAVMGRDLRNGKVRDCGWKCFLRPHKLKGAGDLTEDQILLRCKHWRQCRSCKRHLPAQQFRTITDTRCNECRDTGRLAAIRNQDQILFKAYGLPIGGYAKLLAAQDGKCAICGKSPSGKDTYFSVDHDHTTGAIRALLCRVCNAGLGCFDDDVEQLEMAIAYLKQHKLKEVAN